MQRLGKLAASTIVAALIITASASAATITVNSDADPGDGTCDATECTLREAITAANVDATPDTISFSGLASGSGTIFLDAAALPAITQPVTIDGTTHPDFTEGAPAVLIDGSGLASGAGLTLSAGASTVKGVAIDGFTGNGITVTSNGNTIQGNTIGAGQAVTGVGISIASSNNTIGGTAAGAGNTISAGQDAVVVVSGAGNQIRGNVFSAFGGLAIDLGDDGPTANDALDSDSGANNRQNFPTLSSMTPTASGVTFSGTLSSAPSTQYTLDFYGASGCLGGGTEYLGTTTVTTNGSGVASFTTSEFLGTPDYGVATATDPAGNTSELSVGRPANPNTVAGITNTCDPLAIGQAIAVDAATVTGASYVALPPSGSPNAIGTGSFAGFPTNGGSYGVLSSGSAAHLAPSQPSGEDIGGGNVRGDTDFDVTVLKLDLAVPAGANCLTLDFRFLSDEYPQYLNSPYNDAFIAELDSSSWSTNGSTISAPNNFAFDPSNDVISINSTGNTAMSHAETAGTGYDVGENGGATPLLHASKVVTSGAHSLYLSIFDQGDHALDSAVELDNLRFSTRDPATCAEGATSDVTPPALTLTTPADGSITSDTTPTYSGTAGTAAGDLDTITVKVYSGTTATGTPVQTITTTKSGGTWTVNGTTPLAPGTYTAQAQQSDQAGNSGLSNANTFTVTDSKLLSINDTAVTEGDSGTVNATFTVTLSSAASNTVTVQYATSDGSAVQPADYTTASGPLSFAPGETSKPVTVPVVGDTLDEANETFTVTLSNPTNASIADGSGTGTITDDDDAPLLAIGGDPTVTEGNSGTTNAVFTVTLSAPSGRTITVDFASANGTATQPADYTATSSTLTFNPGDLSKQIVVPVKGDTLDEIDETFTVGLSNASNAAIADGSGTGTITDDDGPPTVSVSDQTVTEGHSGTTNATFTVSLSAASGKPISVQAATSDGTAAQPSDYSSANGTLQFAAGETSKTFAVAVNGDTTIEPDETFTVTLSAPSNAGLGDSSATGTIVNDDSPPPPVVPTISIGNATVNPEGDSGTKPATFTVALSQATTETVSVKFATGNGTAASPADFAAAGGTLTFAPGETSKSVVVNVAGDTVDETDESFTVLLSDPIAGTLAASTGTGTIVDDDTTPVIKPPGGVNPNGVFCGRQHRGRCKGLQFTAQFQDAPGNASWTFDAFNPNPGGGRASTVKPVRLGKLRKAIKSTAPVTVTFKVKGRKADAALRKIRKGKLSRLRITTTFTSASGKTTKAVNEIKLRLR